MPRQLGKRRQGWAGKGDVQFEQAKRKGALIRFAFGIYTANLQDRQRRRSSDYVWLVVLRDAFLALGFLVAAFFEAGFFSATFCFFGLALMAWFFGESALAAPFGGVVVSNP